jgi:hypothetical protein
MAAMEPQIPAVAAAVPLVRRLLHIRAAQAAPVLSLLAIKLPEVLRFHLQDHLNGLAQQV